MPKTLLRLIALVTLAASLQTMTASAADASIIDTHWKLISIRGVPAEEGRSEPHLVFSADGGLSGNTGCNNLGSVYTIDGDRIAFGPIVTTRMYCREVARTERELLKNLRDVGRWIVSDQRLELMTDSGVTLAILEAVES